MIKEYEGCWGFEFFLDDKSLVVWIERIYLKRNIYYGYFVDFFILDNDFIDIWNNIFLIFMNLVKEGNIKFMCNYKEEILRLKEFEMCFKFVEYYSKKLLVIE